MHTVTNSDAIFLLHVDSSEYADSYFVILIVTKMLNKPVMLVYVCRTHKSDNLMQALEY
jgi:hypothetical protein